MIIIDKVLPKIEEKIIKKTIPTVRVVQVPYEEQFVKFIEKPVQK